MIDEIVYKFVLEHDPYLKKIARQFVRRKPVEMREQSADDLYCAAEDLLIRKLSAMTEETFALVSTNPAYRNRMFANLFRDAATPTVQEAFEKTQVSLATPVKNGKAELGDIVSGGLSLGTEDRTLNDENSIRLSQAVNSLPDRERAAIWLVFGVGDDPPMSQAEAGRELNCSQQFINKLIQSGLEKLRSAGLAKTIKDPGPHFSFARSKKRPGAE